MVVGASLVILALIVAAVPVVRLVHLALDGQLDFGQVLMGIVMYVGLLAMVVGGPTPMKIVALLLIIASAVLIPLVSGMGEVWALRRMDDERFEAYARALERNPMDPVARIALARELYKRGDVRQAVEHLEWTLQQYPRLAVHHQTDLDNWKRELGDEPGPAFIYCHICHAEAEPEAQFCPQCGAPFGTLASVQQSIRREGGIVRVVRGWIIGVPAIMLGLFVLLELPAIVAAPIIIAILAVAAWLFLKWVGGEIGRHVE